MVATPNTLAGRLARRVEKLLATRPERVVSLDLFSSSANRINPARTTQGEGRRDPRADRARKIANLFGQNLARRAQYAEAREAAREVPELARSRQVLVSFIFGGAIEEGASEPQAFKIEFSEGARPEVVSAIEEMTRLLRMHRQIPSILSEGILLGDSFSELNYLWTGSTAELIGVLPVWPERVTVEEWRGHLDRYRIDSIDGMRSKTGRDLLPYQVLHYAHTPERGMRYGQPFCRSGFKARRSAEAVEDVLTLMSLTSPREQATHFVPFPEEIDDDKLWEWIWALQDESAADDLWDSEAKLQKKVVPQLETADDFLPVRVYADLPSGAVMPSTVTRKGADLVQLVEVLRFFRDSLFISTGVPASLAGYERNVNAKATLDGQLQGFSLTVRERQTDAAELTRDVYTRGLLARGIIPEEGEFAVIMPPPTEFDRRLRAEVVKIRAEAAATLLNAGVPPAWVFRYALDATDQEADEIAERFRQGEEQAALEHLVRSTAQIAAEESKLPAVVATSGPDVPAVGSDVGGSWTG